MPGAERYCLLADPFELEAFDATISAIVRDRLAGRITAAQAVDLDAHVRDQRKEFIMRHQADGFGADKPACPGASTGADY
jgi:hypothetical protein